MRADRKQIARHFGENLRLCRERAGLSREKLDTLASLGRSRVRKLERGIQEPELETILKLADALSIPLGDLLGGIEWMPACRGRFEFQLAGEDNGRTIGPPRGWMYDPKTVGEVVLTQVIGLHPEHLTPSALSRRIVVDPDDDKETEAITRAIRDLREFGMLLGGDDEAVRPTPAALYAGMLLMGCTCETAPCHCPVGFSRPQEAPCSPA